MITPRAIVAYHKRGRTTLDNRSRSRSDLVHEIHAVHRADDAKAVCGADVSGEGWKESFGSVTCKKCERWGEKRRQEVAKLQRMNG